MRYYFLGIAGTAMASLAALLKMKGHEVWGTDQDIYPPMDGLLKDHQITVYQGYDKKHLDKSFDLAVIGNSLSRGNDEIEEILNRRLSFTSLPALIHKEFVETHHSIVITGTHGKTSITALLSWIFETAGLSPTFLIGGIAGNFSSSMRLGAGKYFIIEGDEYDSAFFDKRPKFLHYFPQHLIINNIEFDHADIYASLTEIKDAFRKLLRLIPGYGLIVANGNDDNVKEVIQEKHSRLQSFGSTNILDWSYNKVQTNGAGSQFDLIHRRESIDTFVLSQPGEHQVGNALSAIAVAHDVGIGWDKIKTALKTFKGVKRRLEYWGKLNGAMVFDDFAHHPTAVRKTLQAVRQIYPQKRIVALFEPRTNTTVRNIFQEQLGSALAIADLILLTPVHRAERIPPHQRLSISGISQKLEVQNKTAKILSSYSEIPQCLLDMVKEDDVLVLLTNGNFGGQYATIKKMINSEDK